MKRVILCALALSILQTAGAQSLPLFQWARDFRSHTSGSLGFSLPEYVRNVGVAVATDGRTFFGGRFTGTMDADPGNATANLVSAGRQDAFLAALDAGGALQWAHRWGGDSTEAVCALTTDDSGNVYALGFFKGAADFDPGAGTTMLSGGATTALFVSKFSSGGALLWARQWGNPAFNVRPASIAVHPAGGIVAVGSALGQSVESCFLLRMDGGGNLLWARQWGGYNDYAMAVGADGAGNIYVGGGHISTTDFDPGPAVFSLTAHGFSFGNAYLSRFDAAGNFLNALQWGDGGFKVELGGIHVSPGGTINIVGWYSGSFRVDFNPSPAPADTAKLPPGVAYRGYVLRLTSSGAFHNVQLLGGGTGNFEVEDVRADGAGNLYIQGTLDSTQDFDPGPGVFNLSRTGNYNRFLLKLDSAGAFGWAYTGAMQHTGVSKTGEVVTYNTFSTGNDMDPGSGTSPAPGNGAFLVKLGAGTAGIGGGADGEGALSLYPNPTESTLTLRSGPGFSGVDITLLDATGRMVRVWRGLSGPALELNLGGLPPGVYALRLTGGDAVQVVRMVKR